MNFNYKNKSKTRGILTELAELKLSFLGDTTSPKDQLLELFKRWYSKDPDNFMSDLHDLQNNDPTF